MAKALWRGSIVVGKVAIPVALHKAADHDDVSFRSLHAECGTPITQERRCPTCQVVIEPGDYAATQRAFEVAPGQFLPITSKEIDAALGAKEIALDRFVTTSLLHQPMLDTTYWVAPTSDPLAIRAYDGLLKAMQKTRLAGIARIPLFSKERIVAIWPVDAYGIEPLIGLTTLFPVTGLRTEAAGDIAEQLRSIAGAGATRQEVQLFAEALQQRVPTAFRWGSIRRYYPNRLRQLVDAKAGRGEPLVVPPAQADAVAPRDLLEALQRSVRGAKTRSRQPAKV